MSHGAVRIPHYEIRFRFVRSSGPGGQNVNKASTKAELYWIPAESAALHGELRERVLRRLAHRLDSGGVLIIKSDRHRERERNRVDCLEKLDEIVAAAAKPEKKRVATRPGKGAHRRRMDTKRKHAEKKQGRGGKWE